MNPFIVALLTFLQYAGYVFLFTVACSVIGTVIRRIIREYFAAKATYAQLIAEGTDMPALFRAYMQAKANGKEEVKL